ncbi:Hypothetical predicted protein [Pelobates cultripes]|uniref:Uncharacterized protein n=1 Tax=Pelobates cultripes TaxID=61616 RepID=A0AAD1R721_PELCU|nr:Hypothetical predicted protein [Pelobates cultripes]
MQPGAELASKLSGCKHSERRETDSLYTLYGDRKYPTEVPRTRRDHGETFLRPKIADLLPDPPCGSDSALEDKDQDLPDLLSQPRNGKVTYQKQPDPQWATRTDIHTMVMDIKTFFTSEMATLKVDIGMLAGKIKAAEDTVQSLGLKQQSADTHLQEVSNTCAALSAKVEHLEDLACQRNLKIQGIPDAIDDGELPHYLRRLFAAALTPKQAKGLQHNGLYRLPGGPRNKDQTPRDVILGFKSQSDKDTILSQVKGYALFMFEQHALSFYHDLSRATLQWRTTFK